MQFSYIREPGSVAASFYSSHDYMNTDYTVNGNFITEHFSLSCYQHKIKHVLLCQPRKTEAESVNNLNEQHTGKKPTIFTELRNFGVSQDTCTYSSTLSKQTKLPINLLC